MNEEKQELKNSIQTICKDCIFNQSTKVDMATKEGGVHSRIVQIGCLAKQLNKDKSLVESDKEETQLYHRLDYFCAYCKNKDWAKHHKLSNTKEQLAFIRKEVEVHTDIIFVLHENHTLQDLTILIGKIKNPLIKKLIFVCNNRKIEFFDVNEALKNVKYQWQFIMPTEDSCIEAQITQASKHLKSRYFIVVQKLAQYDDSLPTIIDRQINDNGKQFCLVKDEDDEGYNNLIMQTRLQKHYKYFEPNYIIDKYKDTEWAHLIMNYRQLNCHK
jgi:hypothetical protein